MTRRVLRENVFMIVFRNDFYPIEEMDEQTKLYLNGIDMEKFSDEEKLEIQVRAKSVLLKFPEIDEKIEKEAEGWSIKRIGKVELAILRLALFEMFYDEEVPVSVAINEAIELSKKFGGDESPAFVNGVLAKFAS